MTDEKMDPQLLQHRLGHNFKDASLLQQALTHRSHSALHNERLEFLGDSVLNCVVASLLFERYEKIDEGDLSRLRANLVKQQSLYEIAQRLELSQFLRLGEGELKSGGFRRPSILADTLEALFGAIFLDSGFDAARDVIRALYVPVLEHVDPRTLGKDAKTLLQEFLQGKKIPLPQYNVIATHGAAHNQEFEIECLVPKLDIQVFGTGGSRRAGEQAAAKLALEAVQLALVKTPSAGRKPRARTTQLKLAGIATIQPDAPDQEPGKGNRPDASDRAGNVKPLKAEVRAEKSDLVDKAERAEKTEKGERGEKAEKADKIDKAAAEKVEPKSETRQEKQEKAVKEPREQKDSRSTAARSEGKSGGDRAEAVAAEPISAAPAASQSRTA
ncbi:MAG: Ribonuclease 3 [Herbaspirillum frisingense]|uniref:Ribonuclease 3 n=1 Tax=Herbaspirillum frisingense TaxID=92645 RepID=A0A7V8FXV1_9BURK|nr:MAG: Ribonuclease 3 [Herbaspirillum frisingense]